jgi:hypothetical protein
MLLALGLVLLAAGLLMAVLRDAVIRYWTSRPLGSLAAGYAANRIGVLVYAALVADIGLILLAVDFESTWLILVSIALFIAGSIVIIAGEVVTYRRLKP